MPRRIRNLNYRRRKTTLRQWREHALSELSLDEVAAKLSMSGAQLSRVERGISPYTQDFLELAARLYRTTPDSLLWQLPGENNWLLLFRKASSEERRRLAEMASAFLKPRNA